MKRIAMLLVVALLCSVMVGCAFDNSDDELSSQTTETSTTKEPKSSTSGENMVILIVNNKDITNGVYVDIDINGRFAKFQLIPVLKELGAIVEWETEKVAKIKINNHNFILDLADKKLSEESSPYSSFIALAPGSSHPQYVEAIEKDLIVDSDSILLFFNYIDVSITIDYDELKVVISNKIG